MPSKFPKSGEYSYGKGIYVVRPYTVAIGGFDLETVFSGRQVDVACRTVVAGFIPLFLQSFQTISILNVLGSDIIKGGKLKSDVSLRCF